MAAFSMPSFVVAVVLALAGFSTASAQQAQWRAPRTSFGQPDLQGVWTNASITQLERTRQFDHLVLTDAEVDKATRAREDQTARAQARTDPTTGAPTDRNTDAGYNRFWLDPGSRIGKVKGTWRSSWIIDPADGRIPYSDAGRARIKAEQAKLGYGGPEERPLPDRCIVALQRNGPPMTNGLYNNHTQIVQAPGYVVIVSEMMQNARIVPLGPASAPSGAVSMFGQSRGHWQGDVLVVETTGFNAYRAREALPAYLSPTAHVTERFSRVGQGELLYEFIVNDPVFYTQPWKGEETFWNDGEKIYEYACHEGNYALAGILRGARVLEAKGLPLEQANAE